VRERVRSRVFRVATVVQLTIVAAVVIITVATGDDGPTKVKVGVVGPQARVVGQAAQSAQRPYDLDVELRRYASRSAAEGAVRDDDVDVALAGRRLLTGADPDASLVALLQSTSRQLRSGATLREAGLSREESRAVLNPPALEVTDVSDGGDSGTGLAIAGVLLLYLGLLSVGYQVSSGVVEEKSSRVIELLLSAIRARQLLAGKVIGIGLVGLLQLMLVVIVGLGIALASGEVDLPPTTATTALLVALYFVLGYALYACAFAVAGALVSRQEDTQSTTTPMLVILVAGYLASFQAVDKPEATLAKVLTYVPPVAPMIVPTRAAQGAVSPPEVLISVALMLVSIAVLIRVAARVYERAVLRMGSPMKLTQALRLARSR
jgi:ABC-2 type transport system permease protein